MSRKKAIPEVKIILLGESGVGKTAIIQRYLYNKFDENTKSNLSMNYVQKIIVINNQEVRLNIWDTIGQEKYRSISKLFLNEANVVILVYSIDVRKSFIELNYWYNLFKECLDQNTVLGVAGNKMDLFLNQETSDDEAMEFAKRCGASFSIFSAKESSNLLEKFINNLVKEYLDKNILNNSDKYTTRSVKLGEKKKDSNDDSDSAGCCGGGGEKVKKKKKRDSIKKSQGYLSSIFLGDNGVGKTSIIKRIGGKKFDREEKHTKEISNTIIEYRNIKLKIFDTDNDKIKTKKFIDIIINSQIFFLVYDIGDKMSFNEIEDWIDNIKKYKEENNNKEKYVLVIIGNKNDKNSQEKEKEDEGIFISEEIKNDYIEEGRQLANEYKGIFRLASAYNNKGLEKLVGNAIDNYLSI